LENFSNYHTTKKNKVIIQNGWDIGYYHTEDVKELFHMRKSDIGEYPWPNEPKEFKSDMIDMWNEIDYISRKLLSFLSIALQLDEGKLGEVLDSFPQPHNTFSNTILGVYHYYYHKNPTATCLVHKDMGMISLIPRASIPGLQVYDNDVMAWIDVERAIGENDIVCISCETLDRITGGYYCGSVHRVVTTVDRQSTVFKLRAKSDGMIDTIGLNSPILQKYCPLQLYTEKQTVSHWIVHGLHYKESVNFSGDKFDNYKSMILDPSQNISLLSQKREEQSM